ncbi:MAG: DEAD/DEAH box helicase, partial [Chthoniobacterales bacterium]
MIDGLLLPLNLPDLWQQNAARMLASGSDVVIDAPTGAGKTRVFELFVETTAGARRGQMVFTVPTRALANDKFREWQARGWNVGLATGDRAENVNAPVLVATLETQRERILSGNAPSTLVVDEYQMIADPKRGLNYELALALLPVTTRVLLLSGSVRNPTDIADWLRRLGREVEMVQVTDRPVPLDDFPIEHLPRTPDSISGFWPRLAMGARLANLTPLLIFAPRRADAERIAKRIADGWPEQNPLVIPGNADQKLGKDLAKMIRRRVAFHHSGLSYEARAGWVEPLAKNGHLDVIVATTGLAAGINFSVRSVFVADTRYQDGPYQREVRPDELLQMFGRAGRRGIDTRGSVLVAPQSPRLFDAAPRQLRRVNEIDWPTLLRVMEEAAANNSLPLYAAASICTQLFSRQSIELGIEGNNTPP